MDILKSKTVATNVGTSTVSSGGLGIDEIIAVKRQGIQYDYTLPMLLSSSNRSWTMFGVVKRIFFRTDTPFESGETIFIIYKVTT